MTAASPPPVAAAAPGATVRAAGLTLIACVFFAAANACARAVQIEGPVPPQQVTAFRYLFGFLTLLPLILRSPVPVFRTAVPRLHALRIAFGVGGVVCMFAALARLPLADVTAIAWANPLVAMALAALVLGERVSRLRWLWAGLGFLGVLVMMRPSGAAFGPSGLLALGAALCIGAEVTAIRALAVRDPGLTVLAIANAGGAIAGALLAAPVLVWPDPAQAVLMAGTGISMVIGQLLFMEAIRLRETSFVAPFYYATLVFAFAIGMVAFGEVPDLWVYLGAAAIVGSGLGVTVQGTREARRAAGAG